MRQSKKTLKLGLMALAASTLLAGCGDVTALPDAGFYYQDILLNSDGTSANLTNNTIKQIYDALVTSGDSNSQKVFENILYIYARDVFGSFYDRDADGDIILSSSYKDGDTRGLKWTVENGSDEQIQAFATAHAGFGGKADRVKNFYESVMYEVNETFYGYVTNTEYQERNRFQEEKFYDAQTEAYYKLEEVEGSPKTDFVQVYGFSRLYRDSALDGELLGKYFNNIYDTYINYIELTVLPDIYRNELTAYYLQNQNFGTLRMSSARKVDYISLTQNSERPDSIYNLMNAYCKIVINQDVTNYAAADLAYLEENKNTIFGFTFLESLSKGTYAEFIEQNVDADHVAFVTTVAEDVYTLASWTPYDLNVILPDADDLTYVTNLVGTDTSIYVESSLGDIIDDYSKLSDNRFQDDETIRTDFTNSGAYSKETGLTIKYQALLTQDNTSYDWVMAGGLSSLPETYQRRAFLSQVATEFYDVGKNETGTYGINKNGNYYLLSSPYETGSDTPYLITTTSETSSTYYLVRIDEAVKGSYIDSSSTDQHKFSDEKAWDVAHTMAYSLSSSDSWRSAARSYFVEQMKFIFHDTDVYNWFKSTYPDIYDD